MVGLDDEIQETGTRELDIDLRRRGGSFGVRVVEAQQAYAGCSGLALEVQHDPGINAVAVHSALLVDERYRGSNLQLRRRRQPDEGAAAFSGQGGDGVAPQTGDYSLRQFDRVWTHEFRT
jgi:hypothetical protein